MNKVFVVTDGPSLREALAEADASDRVVVAEGAFLEPPALAVREGRWVATWAPGTIHAAEGDPPATPPILEPATRDALAAKLATETTTGAGDFLAALAELSKQSDLLARHAESVNVLLTSLGRSIADWCVAFGRLHERAFATADLPPPAPAEPPPPPPEVAGIVARIRRDAHTWREPELALVIADEIEAGAGWRDAPAETATPPRDCPAPVPRDELAAVARELWTARGMDGVGWITGVWNVHGVVRLAALAIDGEVGRAETRLSAPSASDPHGIRLALARCVDRLASRKLPRPPGSGDHWNPPPVLLADGRRAFRLHPDQVGPESLDVIVTDLRWGDAPVPADASGAPGPAPGDSSPLPDRRT